MLKAKIKTLQIFASIVVAYFNVAISNAHAEEGVEVGVGFPGAITSGSNYTFATYVQGMYAFSMKAAIALSTLMLIYAGYKYMTSRGDSSSINEAKDIIFSTLMGAALLMLVVLVGNIAGIEIKTKP